MDAATLRSVPLFASLDSEATAELGKYLTIHDYPKSATIFRNGDPGDAMYLIDVGKVRISITDADGHVVTLAELGQRSGDGKCEVGQTDTERFSVVHEKRSASHAGVAHDVDRSFAANGRAFATSRLAKRKSGRSLAYDLRRSRSR